MRRSRDYYPESAMARLLSRIARPSDDLLDAITELFDKLSPDLALQLARHAARRFNLSHAVHILRECSARFPASSWDAQNKLVLEMKEQAARYTARHKETNEDELVPSTRELFNDAVEFYLRTSPKADQQRGDSDKKVLDLRLELATHLINNVGYVDALEVCEEALHKAIAAGAPIEEGIVHQFQELLWDIVEEFERAMDTIEKDKLEGREFPWAPWSKLDEHRAHYNRVEQALSLCEGFSFNP